MIQTPWTRVSCGQRAGTLVMDIAALGWWTTSTWTLMLWMETRTTVVCTMEPLSCCGSGAKVTTSAGRLLPGVSSLEFWLHFIISYCNILLQKNMHQPSNLKLQKLNHYHSIKSYCIAPTTVDCWTVWFIGRALVFVHTLNKAATKILKKEA